MKYTRRSFKRMNYCQFCGQHYCDEHKYLHEVCEEVYEFFLEEIKEKLIMKLNIVEEIQRRFIK